MKKDTIYIDVEDDITSIIDRIKSSPEKIIALVPPKGSAVLQSVVNLKLLKRAADSMGKKPVIVTSNQALTALAGGLNIHIAKNLQSKPVLITDDKNAEIVNDEDEVEVSDKLSDIEDRPNHVNLREDGDELELSGEEIESLNSPDSGETEESDKKKNKDNKHNSIPNFDNFRKKLLMGGGIICLLLLVLVLVFGRTKAKIVVRAETTPVDVVFDAKLDANIAQSDPSSNILRALIQESKKTVSQTFQATGQQDLGTKASGQVTISATCSPSTFGLTIPSGTAVSSGDKSFITQETATLDDLGPGCVLSDTVAVVASQNGDQFNLSPRNFTVAGNSSVTAKGTQMSGGTSRVVKVISQTDIDKAKEQINQQDTSTVKNDLKQAFGRTDIIILEDSFISSFGEPTSEPAVNQEANEGKLTMQVSYSILAVAKNDLGASLDSFIATQMTNKDQQRVYNNGLDNVRFEKQSVSGRTAMYKISTTGQYGPQFDLEAIKKELAGKKFGEMRSYIQNLPGVKGSDINLSPFWARRAPDASRIHINLDVDKNSLSN
ncbi:hypothetical protein H6801_01075 [Candidatus Nomurabacteria bacterium]|nr:hypothetical protein [Candidatus Nomurabacteria bacterium]